MAIMTINAVAKAGSASWTGNYSLIWSGLRYPMFTRTHPLYIMNLAAAILLRQELKL